MSLLINIYVAIVQASLRLSFCCLEISVIAYTSWNGYRSFSVSFKVGDLMKGKIFWQQMPKMCLGRKKNNQERRKTKEKTEKFICIRGNAHCTEGFESIYLPLSTCNHLHARVYPWARICTTVLASSAVTSTCTKTTGEGMNVLAPGLAPDFFNGCKQVVKTVIHQN